MIQRLQVQSLEKLMVSGPSVDKSTQEQTSGRYIAATSYGRGIQFSRVGATFYFQERLGMYRGERTWYEPGLLSGWVRHGAEVLQEVSW